MTRSHAALIIGWLALGPGTLLFPENADAIPGTTASLIDAPRSGSESLPPAEQAPGDPPPPVARVEIAPAAAAQDVAAADTRIPCLHTLSSNPLHENNTEDALCSDVIELHQPLSVQFGRRLAIGSGILGKTDGIRVDYRLRSGMTLQGVAGYPVLSSKDEFNTTRRMFGLSADTGTIARDWNLNAYAMGETDNAQLDNRAVGGILRYLRPKRSLLVFMDYDTNRDAMNAITASGAWKLPGKTTLSATIDVNNNAIHKRQKEHLQHSMAATDGWTWVLPDDRIKHYTSQQQREVTTRGLSLSHTFSQRLKLSGDFAMLDIFENSLPENTASPSKLPSEYFYHLKLTGKDLFIPGNSNKLDIRHSITESSRTSTASIDTRYAINRLWNVIPRLRTEHSDNYSEKPDKWVATPAVKMEYRWKQAYGFEIEAGGKWSNQALSAASTGRSSYFLNLGYQAKF